MTSNVQSLKPLFFTEEEALATLDLFLASEVDSDAVKDAAMMKLTELVRRYMAETNSAGVASTFVGTPFIETEGESHTEAAVNVRPTISAYAKPAIPRQSTRRGVPLMLQAGAVN